MLMTMMMDDEMMKKNDESTCYMTISNFTYIMIVTNLFSYIT